MWRLWLATFFWGLNWAAVKILLTGIPPWTLRAVGLGGGGVLLAGTAVALRRSLSIPRRFWRHVLVGAILNVAAFNLFAAFAQLSMPASRAAILTFTMPLWAALFGWLVLGERADVVRVLSLLLGAAGLGALSLPFWPVISEGGVPLGLGYVLGAAITWAAGTVYLKRFVVDTDPLALTTWQLLLGALACGAGMLAFETPRIDLSEPRAPWAFLFHLALPQALSYALWFDLLRRVPASTATLGTLLIPIFGVLGAVLVLGEQPTTVDLGGLALILTAVGLDQGWRRGR